MKLLSMILVVLAILGMYYVFCGYTESFVNRLSKSNFPESQDNTILVNDYPTKQPQELTKHTYEQNSKLAPVSPMSSYEQVTNNKKYWNTPNNGSCSPAEFCGSMYGSKKISHPSEPKPNDLSTRVNYYNIEN